MPDSKKGSTLPDPLLRHPYMRFRGVLENPRPAGRSVDSALTPFGGSGIRHSPKDRDMIGIEQWNNSNILTFPFRTI